MSRMMSGLCFLFLCLVASCGLPKDSREQLKQVPVRLAQLQSEIATAKSDYATFTSRSEYGFFKPYAEREKWSSQFEAAEKELRALEQLWSESLEPLQKRNKSKDLAEVEKGLVAIDAGAKTIGDQLRFVSTRRQILTRARDEAPKLHAEAKKAYDLSLAGLALLESKIAKARTAFAHRTGAIDDRAKVTRGHYSELANRWVTVDNQFARTKTGDADYAVFADAATSLHKEAELIGKTEPKLTADLAGLARSYSKTLVDVRADFYLTAGRTSWDNWSDFSTDNDYTYNAVKVEPEVYDYFVALPPDKDLATLRKSSVDEAMWNKLGVDKKESFPGGDDDAVFWLADDLVRYYHKYKVEENGQVSETDWIEVDEVAFELHEADLGMTIVSKPSGYFEDESLTQATPPGLAFVGDPAYGKWEQRNDGTSFWAFYGQWRFFNDMLGPSYNGYSRTEWDNWNRNYRGNKSYYGDNEDDPRYGTGGSYTNTRIGSTPYAKRMRAEEGSSIRGAGSSSRNRGPGSGK